MLILACFIIKAVSNLRISAVKLYLDSAKYGIKRDKRTEKLPNISLSLDFVNKPPSLLSPPLEGTKLNKPPLGLIELLRSFNHPSIKFLNLNFTNFFKVSSVLVIVVLFCQKRSFFWIDI